MLKLHYEGMELEPILHCAVCETECLQK